MEIDHGAIKIDVEPVQLNSSTSFIPAVDAECEAVSLLDMTYPYSCKFCNKLAEEPVLNIQCGHLFCWRCVFVRLKYELELNQSCPCCQTRLDFSAVTGNLIPVRTGPVPGEEFDLRTQLEPVFGEEEEQIEKALIEASISRGEGYYVRPRPLTLQGYYGSLSHFHCTNLMRFTVATSNICNFLVSLCKEPHDLGEVRVLINRRMDHLIHEFLVAWKWLTGLEYPELPEAWNKLDCPQLPEPWNEKLLEQTKAISVKEYVSAEKKRRVEEKVYLAGRSVVFSDTSKVHANASSICKFSCTICSKMEENVSCPSGEPQENVVNSIIIRSNDPGWKYCTIAESPKREKVKCNFCKHETTGGVYRFKKHLVCRRGYVDPCPHVHDEVKREISDYLAKGAAQKVKRIQQRQDARGEVDIRNRCDNEDVILIGGSKPKKAKVLGQTDKYFIRDPEAVVDERRKSKQGTISAKLKKEERKKTIQYITR